MRVIQHFFRGLTLRPQGMIVVITGFLPIFAIVTMFPLVPGMIQHFASDPRAMAKVPLMVTAPGLAVAVLAPFAGYFVDRFGRRRLLLWSTFFYGILGAAPFLLGSLNAIIGARLLLGVCEAGIITVVNTLLGDYWEDIGRRNWLFLQGMFGPLFGSVVVLAAGSFAKIQWNCGFLIYLIALPIWVAMVKYVFEPQKPKIAMPAAAEEPDRFQPFPMRHATSVAALTLFSACLYYVFIVNGALVFKEVGISDPVELGKLYTIPSLFILLGALLFRLLAKWPSIAQIAAFLAVLSTGLFFMGVAKTPLGVMIAMAVQQTGAGMTVVTLIAWAQTRFPFAHRGRGMGVWTSAFFFGQFVSPLAVHQFNLLSGTMQGAFQLAGLVGFIAMAIMILMGMRRGAPMPAHG